MSLLATVLPLSSRRAVKLADHASSEIENQKTPAAVFIDLSKTFETLSNDILLYKLKYCGVTG